MFSKIESGIPLVFFLLFAAWFWKTTLLWKREDAERKKRHYAFQVWVEPFSEYMRTLDHTLYSDEGFRIFLLKKGMNYDLWIEEGKSLTRENNLMPDRENQRTSKSIEQPSGIHHDDETH